MSRKKKTKQNLGDASLQSQKAVMRRFVVTVNEQADIETEHSFIYLWVRWGKEMTILSVGGVSAEKVVLFAMCWWAGRWVHVSFQSLW